MSEITVDTEWEAAKERIAASREQNALLPVGQTTSGRTLEHDDGLIVAGEVVPVEDIAEGEIVEGFATNPMFDELVEQFGSPEVMAAIVTDGITHNKQLVNAASGDIVRTHEENMRLIGVAWPFPELPITVREQMMVNLLKRTTQKTHEMKAIETSRSSDAETIVIDAVESEGADA